MNRLGRRKVAFLLGEGGLASPADFGGKGAALATLSNLGVPVPPAFTVTTAVARAFAQHARTPKRLARQIDWGMAALERQTGKRFGHADDPLLVSVRSGAAVSMPGMMDTVLNLGINSEICEGLARVSSRRFALDCFRRFLSMFGSVVVGVDGEHFESELADVKARAGVKHDCELDCGNLEDACNRFRLLIELDSGRPVTENPREQLDQALQAVLRSWNNPRAVAYRQANQIRNDLGTAVNVQAMVYGNRDAESGTGVAFSHNVNTGEPGLWGEFLMNAQGEDVVAGVRTPVPINSLRAIDGALYARLESIVLMLERQYNDVVDVEFTIESGQLFILQVRTAKLTALAAATVAARLVWGGRLTKEQAVARLSDQQIESLQAKRFEPAALADAVSNSLITRGLPASPGAAVGAVAQSSQEAVERAARGERVILVRPDTSPDDLPGMLAAAAIVTRTGGATSHAAVVARSMGKPAIVGCSSFWVEPGQIVSVCGGSGVVVDGSVSLAEASSTRETNLILRWRHAQEAKACWPAPRLNFGTVGQQVSPARLIADFYLTDMMSREAAGTALSCQAAALRTRVHVWVAERLATYLVVAVGGEVRHAQKNWSECASELDALMREFRLELDGPREKAQAATIEKLKSAGRKTQERFLELIEHVFSRGHWGFSFGGHAWARIAKTAREFLTGKVGHSVFADHAFDLQHNNGTVFGKHSMIKLPPEATPHFPGNETTRLRSLVERLLDAKKKTLSVLQLRDKLRAIRLDWSAEVQALFQKGERLNLWAAG